MAPNEGHSLRFLPTTVWWKFSEPVKEKQKDSINKRTKKHTWNPTCYPDIRYNILPDAKEEKSQKYLPRQFCLMLRGGKKVLIRAFRGPSHFLFVTTQIFSPAFVPALLLCSVTGNGFYLKQKQHWRQ